MSFTVNCLFKYYKARKLFVMLFILLLLFASPTHAGRQRLYPAYKIDEVIKAAREYLGCYYTWGGNSCTTGMDCSGFMRECFKKVGIDIPRISREQANFRRGDDVSKISNLQKGDLVFFLKTGTTRINHVGLVTSVVGSRIKFIHASDDSNGVTEEELDGRWYKKFKKGKRLFETID